MAKRKVIEIIEGHCVAEIWEKIRENDGKRFYDTVFHRRYRDDEGEERSSDCLQLKDLDNAHIVLVKAKNYIRDQLWKARNSPGYTREIPQDSYAEEE
jgi:hypothetical protein